MEPLRVKKFSDLTPEEVLKMAPCMDMDLYIFNNVFNGDMAPEDEPVLMGAVPTFSQRWASCQPLYAMIATQIPSLEVSMIGREDARFDMVFRDNKSFRFKNPQYITRIKSGDITVHGVSFAHAISKFAICYILGVREKVTEIQEQYGREDI